MGDGAYGRSTRVNAPVIHAPETVDITKLKPHPQNYRTHTDAQLEHIMASITEHGLYRNVVVAEDYTILAGHGVTEAAHRLHMTTLTVVRLDVMPDSPEALKVLAADNELARFAEVDDRALAELLRGISETNLSGLLGTGYDELALAGLLMVTRDADEVEDFDVAAEWVGLPDYEPTPDRTTLIIYFDDPEARETFIADHFDGSLWRRWNAEKWGAYWPARTEAKQPVSKQWTEVA